MTQKMKKTNSSSVEEEATATTMEDVYYTMVSSPKRKRSVSIIDEEERRETIEHTTRHSKRTKLGISNSNSNSSIDSPTSQIYTVEENEEQNNTIPQEGEKDTEEKEFAIAFHKLCDDTIEHIFSFLDPASILPLGVCSKSMNSLLSHMGKQTCDRVVLNNNNNNITSKKNTEICTEDFHGSQKNGKENNTITRSFKITLAERFLRDEGFSSIAELRDNSEDGQGGLTLESCVERALYYDVLHRWDNNTNNKKVKDIIDEVEDTEIALQRKILRTPLIDGLYLLGFQPEYLYAYKKHQSEIENGQSAQAGQAPRSFDLEKTAREYGIVGVFDHAFNLIRHFNLDTREGPSNSKKEAFEYICARNITTSNVLLLLKRTKNILDTKDRADVARLIMTKVLLVHNNANAELDDVDVIEKAMQLYREVVQGTNTTAKKQKKTTGGVTASFTVPARTRTLRNRRSNDIHHFNNYKNSQSVEHNDNNNGNDDVTTIPTLLEHALEIANSISNRPTKSFCLEAIAMKYCVLKNNTGDAHHAHAHAVEKALEVTKKIPNVKNKNRAYSVLIESMLDNADDEEKEDVIQQALQISEFITNNTSVDYVLRNICIKCCRNLLTTRDTDTVVDGVGVVENSSNSNSMIDEMLDIARRIKNRVVQSQALESIALAAFKTETTTEEHQHTHHTHNPDRALSILKEINKGDIHCRRAIERTLELIVGCTFETHGIEEALKISKSFSSSDDKVFLDKCLQTICAKACEKKMMKEVIQLGSLMTSYQSKFYILCKVYLHSRSVNEIIQYATACFTVDSERDARLADLVRKACVDNEILVAIELVVNGIKNNTHRRSCIRHIARHSIERRLYDDISKVLSPNTNENGVLLEVGSSNYMLFLDICFEFRYMNVCDCHMEYSCGLEQLANISSRIPCDKMKSRAKQHLVDEYCQYAILLDDWNTSIAQQQQQGSSANANPLSSLFVAADDMVKEAMNIAQTIPLKRYENKCAIHIKSCLSVLMMRAAKRMN